MPPPKLVAVFPCASRAVTWTAGVIVVAATVVTGCTVNASCVAAPGVTVVDLGAAPGGWSQYVRQAMGDGGRVLALDILDMPPLAGVEFLHGDFREDAVLSELEARLDGQHVDLVLSDMAPNMSGVDVVDQARAMHLAELAMEFADHHLRTGGTFLIKLFQGVGFDEYVRQLRQRYEKVAIRKPAASRKRSPEVYALAQGKRAQPR